MTRMTRVHGTYHGYSQHRTLGEEPCEDCRRASRDRSRARRAAGLEVFTAARAKARLRAYHRLAEEHPLDFVRLAIEETSRRTP